MALAWFSDPLGENYFCVVGDPIDHSLSPRIHQAFAAQFDLAIRYERVRVPAGCLAAAVAEFQRCGGRGMNVTVPLKTEAWAAAKIRTPRATAAGAVNTLWFNGAGQLSGDNTDGAGLVRDLSVNHGVELAGATILLLGAGGAARGVVPALLSSGVGRLQISNRSANKVDEIIRASVAPERLEAVAWGGVGAKAADIVINATSLSLHNELPPLAAEVLQQCSVCYDMMYRTEPTVFVEHARRAGVGLALDGLGMLVEQAAEAFEIWLQQRPETNSVMRALRSG